MKFNLEGFKKKTQEVVEDNKGLIKSVVAGGVIIMTPTQELLAGEKGTVEKEEARMEIKMDAKTDVADPAAISFADALEMTKDTEDVQNKMMDRNSIRLLELGLDGYNNDIVMKNEQGNVLIAETFADLEDKLDKMGIEYTVNRVVNDQDEGELTVTFRGKGAEPTQITSKKNGDEIVMVVNQ